MPNLLKDMPKLTKRDFRQISFWVRGFEAEDIMSASEIALFDKEKLKKLAHFYFEEKWSYTASSTTKTYEKLWGAGSYKGPKTCRLER